MAPPWQETPTKVVIEFQKSSQGASRLIKLKHTPGQVPYQLQGRMPPEVWNAFMTELLELTKTHPYVVRPGVGKMCEWLAGLACICVVGFCCSDGDGGDHAAWMQQLHQVVQKYTVPFAQGGGNLSIQQVHGNYWVQVDVNTAMMAVGQPIQQPAKFAEPKGYPPQEYSSQPPGYPPQPGAPQGYPPQPGAPPPGYPAPPGAPPPGYPQAVPPSGGKGY